MDEPLLIPRLSLLVQSVDEASEQVVLEDLRTGGRERFDSLRALATAWLAAAAPPEHPPDPGELP